MKGSKKRKRMFYCMNHINPAWTDAVLPNGNTAAGSLFAQKVAQGTETGLRLIA
jgi:hypothetical protein